MASVCVSHTRVASDFGVFLMCRYYYTHNSGLQAQNVIFTQSDLQAEPKVFLDPNKFSSDGTIALDSFTFSEGGSLVAYSTGRSVASGTPIHEYCRGLFRLQSVHSQL